MLQFTQPFILWALAGLAIPLYLHLAHRRPALRWPFPSTRFLQPNPIPRRGRRRIHNPLLLLLRMLLYSLLIFAVSGPHWVSSTAPAHLDPDRILLVDVSAGTSGWGVHADILESVPVKLSQWHGSRVGLIVFADEVLLALPPSRDHAPILSALRETTPVPVAARPEFAFERAAEWTAETDTEWHVFSDFQKSSWESVATADARGRIHLHPMGRSPRHNVGIAAAVSYPVQDNRLEVVAHIRNDTPTERLQTVWLESESQSISREASVPAWETVSVAWQIPIPRDPKGRIHIDGPDYPMDDEWHIYLGFPPPIRVLAPVPDPADRSAHEEAYFVQTALETFTGAETHRFEVHFLSPNMIRPALLAEYDAIFLGFSALRHSDLDAETIRGFSQSGGLVVVTLDSGANQALNRIRELGIAPLRYAGQSGQAMVRQAADRIARIPEWSPLGQVFDHDSARDLYLARIYRHVRIDGVTDGQTLLRTEGADPLLIHLPHGDGQWLVSALAWHSGVSDLPMRNAFLPVVKELFLMGAPREGGVIHAYCQSRVPADLRPLDPDNLLQPGVRIDLSRPLVLNVDRAESDIETMDTDELAQRLESATRQVGAIATRGDPGLPLWHWLASVALIILMIESLVASRVRSNASDLRPEPATPTTQLPTPPISNPQDNSKVEVTPNA